MSALASWQAFHEPPLSRPVVTLSMNLARIAAFMRQRRGNINVAWWARSVVRGATFLPHKCGDPKASRFMAPMRVQSWRWRLPMNPAFLAADVRRLKLLEQNDIRASLRRLLRFMGSRREISFRGILSPPSGERAGRGDLLGGSWSQCAIAGSWRLLRHGFWA
jgi:hypothetical protein